MYLSNLSNIFKKRDFTRKRLTSYDKTGGNDDRLHIAPGQTVTIATDRGAGVITHIWTTLLNAPDWERNCLRKIVVTMYWDDSDHPSVQAPIGDFFGMGHAMSKNYVSAPLQMSPENGCGFNCWWPMPFKKSFRIDITNECNTELLFYFYIDYEIHAQADPDAMYFHALWNRQLTVGHDKANFENHDKWCFTGNNLDGSENYVILDAEGEGIYCGCNLGIHNLDQTKHWNWWGEGDDMIFVDGAKVPTFNGTGSEDYINTSWCPQQEYNAPYHGIILGGTENWGGKIAVYRYHIQDPINFNKSIKVTIEHGHNNNRSDDWSSVAYWYQTGIHSAFAPIAPVAERMPVDENALKWGDTPILEKA